MSKQRSAVLAAGLLLSTVMAFPAAAQGVPPSSEAPVPELPSVTKKKEYVPEALLSLTAEGEAGLQFHDNVFRSPTNEKTDIAAIVSPRLTLRSHAEEYSVRVRGSVEAGEFFSHDENNYIDGGLDGKGRYNLNPDLSLLARANARRDHVAIGSFVDEPDRALTEPVEYTYADAGAGVEATPGQYFFSLLGDWLAYDYENVRRQNGTLSINDDRDYDQWSAAARAGYYVQPKTLTYVKGILNTREYDERIDNTLASPLDSDGYTLAAGVEFGDRKTDDFWIDANLGYLEQDYDDDFRPDVDGLAANADLIWRVTPRFTVTGLLARSAEESSLTAASGYLRTEVASTAEYWLTDAWAIGGHARYTNYDFEVNTSGGALEREDDVYDTRLGVRYYFLEHYSIGVEYGYVTRESNDSGVEYDTNTVFARLGVNY